MPKYYPNKAVSQFRIDIAIFKKLKAIAARENRTMNNQLECFIMESVARYEAEHGPVQVPADQDE